jgi:hypothetical protein
MLAPLKNIDSLRRGYAFGEPTWYTKKHLGIDYICATGTPVFAPESGVATQRYGAQGGNTVELVGSLTHRFMHLSRYGKGGKVNAGDVIGYVGNTGNTTTGPHLHWDTRRNGSSWEFFKSYVNPEGLLPKEEPKTQRRRMEIESGVTLAAITDGVILRTVPTEVDGQWSQNAQLNNGDHCEVIEQTPGNEWVHVNAAGVKQGWARITDFRVVYRKQEWQNAGSNKETIKQAITAKAQELLSFVQGL